MEKIKQILQGNKKNSSEAKALDKLELGMLDIKYEGKVEIVEEGGNKYKIELATILAKVLADNESSISPSWVSMLASGYTNQNKMKTTVAESSKKSPLPLVPECETIPMSAKDFKDHKIGLYAVFIEELTTLQARYGVSCMDMADVTSEGIFEKQDREEYACKIKEETVSPEIEGVITRLINSYDSLTKNGEYYILLINEEESLSKVKNATEELKGLFSLVSRYEYTITFGGVIDDMT